MITERYIFGSVQARRFLRDTDQRHVDLFRVREMTEKLLAGGSWGLPNQQPVRMKNGRMIDGHHRMLTVLMAGQPMEMPVEADRKSHEAILRAGAYPSRNTTRS